MQLVIHKLVHKIVCGSQAINMCGAPTVCWVVCWCWGPRKPAEANKNILVVTSVWKKMNRGE